ncbi:hypothetical protein BST81_22420 [Leptolyngbya sp. 'hensonii']|uniref:MlaD family protein n=1 Tax=Leptolyngbya sp. 'hensonii' TaxID=1922337 RepID=UPI00094FAEA6|nr:MlaD family protein [Leptolyngbya sp. 'hensonii']OLP16161.1 hypothetical protein BST81_22420 [Leptolyngbya sp. 'hensonii']
MRTRTVREGSAGLLILLGIAFFGGLGLWLRGFNPSNRTYKAIVEFASARGIQVGTPVRYRGVTVGKIIAIRPGSNGVDVELQISPADLIIPRDSLVEASQSGLIGETFIDIIPQKSIPQGAISARPLDAGCDRTQIICNGSRLPGQAGASVDELIRSSIRFTRQLSDPNFVENVKVLTKNASAAAAGIARMTNELTGLTRAVRLEVGSLSRSAQNTTNSLALTATSIGTTADKFGFTALQINSLLVENRATLTSTLNNLSQASEQLQLSVRSLSPLLSRVEQGELLANLEQLSANAAQASANLRDLSKNLNDPTVIVRLQQTLDSARATFENAQKITSDLDELTGDPAFRSNLRRLVNGLSTLVSSAEQLQEQAMIAQSLTPLKLPEESQPSRKITVTVPPSTYTFSTSDNRLKALDPAIVLTEQTLHNISPTPISAP